MFKFTKQTADVLISNERDTVCVFFALMFWSLTVNVFKYKLTFYGALWVLFVYNENVRSCETVADLTSLMLLFKGTPPSFRKY